MIAQSLTLHETIPGHYLQAAMLTENRATKLPAIARLVYAEGPKGAPSASEDVINAFP